jgi:hypothetical protein
VDSSGPTTYIFILLDIISWKEEEEKSLGVEREMLLFFKL